MKRSSKKSLCLLLLLGSCLCSYCQKINTVRNGFLNPPASARPGVYWYFMDGNMNKASITADLESMKKAGIGNVIFLEVNVGLPVGPIDFLSGQWQDIFKHAVSESKRLGIEITLGIGPGWTGSGGPWVPASQSMQHLVSAAITVTGGGMKKIKLPLPLPKKPYFGEGVFTPELKKDWADYYKDVAVLAYPTPSTNANIDDLDEKALYYRAPYSSAPGVKQFLPSKAKYDDVEKGSAISKKTIIDITDKLHRDGTLEWDVPPGNWTIVRFVSRNNGAITRPAPVTGLGFESDKFDTVALNEHLDHYIGSLLKKTGKPDPHAAGGLKRLHMDSWEMGSQNWTGRFREEFMKRRGYDPLPFYPVYAGSIVESREISERFLWDLRQTSQELVLEYHAAAVKKYAHKNGLSLSIEPYDMNPAADLELGSVADMVMCEFWSKGYGFNSSFSCIEATSVAHVNGQATVPAEAFTAQNDEGWRQYPGAMKNQGDWAFATGINRFVYHTFINQVLNDTLRPGMTMGPYGVHWDRGQTWWPMVSGYHNYISRSQYVLQQGRAVADILYLTPEGAPHVFRPPSSALKGNDTIPDRRGYNFDGCAPGQLYTASVKNGLIVFPGGAAYHLLVLPAVQTMTPALLSKILSLVKAGATVVGSPPVKSPGLSGYPACDSQLQAMAQTLWGTLSSPSNKTIRKYGLGKIIFGGELARQINDLYPEYDLTAGLLNSMGLAHDFESDKPLRYTHRSSPQWDIYFVANTTNANEKAKAVFRSVKGTPQLWDPVTGEIRTLAQFVKKGSQTIVRLQFEPYQSYFIVFDKATRSKPASNKENFPVFNTVAALDGPWQVSFDPKRGGPQQATFAKLTDWTQSEAEGIKYYSGIAVYKKHFSLPANVSLAHGRIYLDLGDIKNLASIKLNGRDLGVIWTAPWRVDITGALLKGENHLEIAVANLWVNRLIGDEKLPDDGIKDDKWPEWLTRGLPRPSRRITFSTFHPYNQHSPLFKSGLIGPVTLQHSSF
ncbi:MAG: glycosyl hydrolase [Mucilaginibacter sp.]